MSDHARILEAHLADFICGQYGVAATILTSKETKRGREVWKGCVSGIPDSKTFRAYDHVGLLYLIHRYYFKPAYVIAAVLTADPEPLPVKKKI